MASRPEPSYFRRRLAVGDARAERELTEKKKGRVPKDPPNPNVTPAPPPIGTQAGSHVNR